MKNQFGKTVEQKDMTAGGTSGWLPNHPSNPAPTKDKKERTHPRASVLPKL